MSFRIKFWGVRGSIACPQSSHMKYGGNTSCVEVDLGGRRIVFDAGTGIRGLGKDFLTTDVRDIFLLLTHTHWDHINGFPFFVPAYDPRRTMRIMAGHLKHSGGIQAVMSSQMNNPVFPVPMEAMQAKARFIDFECGESFKLFDDVNIVTKPLNHPNGATGYRIEYGGRAACYVTDTEHVPGKPDENVLALIDGADLVIYDCTYTEKEFPTRIGWGHSTWNEAMRLCKAANAKQLVIFHHDPDHDDVFMEGLEREAQAAWSQCVVARESMVLTL